MEVREDQPRDEIWVNIRLCVSSHLLPLLYRSVEIATPSSSEKGIFGDLYSFQLFNIKNALLVSSVMK